MAIDHYGGFMNNSRDVLEIIDGTMGIACKQLKEIMKEVRKAVENHCSSVRICFNKTPLRVEILTMLHNVNIFSTIGYDYTKDGGYTLILGW